MSSQRKYDGYEHELDIKSDLFLRGTGSMHSSAMVQDNEDSVDLENDDRGL